MNSAFFRLIFRSELRNKFALFFIILASVPALILGGVALLLIDISHRHDVANLEAQLIDEKTSEIEKFFSDTLGILELRVGFTQTSEIASSEQKFLLEGLMEEHRAFEEVSFIGLEGRESAKRFRDGTEFLCQREEDECNDVSRLPKFQIPAAGKNFIGAVSYTLSGPVITFSAPVRNRNDDIIQVLSAEVNLSQVVRSIENARLGAAGHLLLLDRDGALIAGREHRGVGIGVDLSQFERVGRLMEGEQLGGLDEEDRYRSIFTHEPVVGAGKRIGGIGWLLMAEWPLRDADAIIDDVKNQVLRVTIFGIIAVLLLAFLFANRLLQPIAALKRGAAEIEEGNFEKQVVIRTNDEFQELGSAFNKMAQGLKRLQELKNEFTFIAAHELRTPVTAIRGYISMIREGTAGSVSETARKYLDTVWEANERLVRLINDILEIARSEAGRIKIEVFAVDIRESVRSVFEETKPLADEKKLSLAYERSDELRLVLADTARLKEILVNLVSNAIKYNREGGWVKISHELEENFLVTHVEDNGIGISLEDQKHMFGKFFRADSARVQKITGTGLGMFITKELVEKMGGTIWLQSEEGKGSRFSFKLPAVS
ncbi:MAG: ATP-binding protein [bacterium]|nr:ATP-binding protein [bacterium]